MKTTDARFIVKESAPGVGLGLFAAAAIRKGEFVIEYTGRKIKTKEADASDSRYLFEIDKDWTLDGPPEINTAGYINHSCDPNCESDIMDGHVMICAIKDIAPGEELGFDYGQEYFDEFIKPHGCKCGAKKHRS